MADPLLRNVPPHSKEAERAVLGALLLDPRAVDVVRPELTPDDFYEGRNATVYEAILALAAGRRPTDLVLVHDDLEARGVLGSVGGAEYLAELAEAVPTSANAAYYARRVADKAAQRRLIEAAALIQRDAFESVADVSGLLQRAERSLLDATRRRGALKGRWLHEVLHEEVRRINDREAAPVVPTGFHDLDDLIGGFMPEELVVVGARPGTGKSTFCGGLALNVAKATGKAVAFFALEMRDVGLAQNWLSASGGVRADAIRDPRLLDARDQRLLWQAFEHLSELPIVVYDRPGMNVMDIASATRRLAAEREVGLVVVDYVQRLRPLDAREKKIQTVAHATLELKELARELHVPLVAAAQVNRDAGKRRDPRPRPDDLKEAGALEEEADKVLLLHRPHYYDAEASEEEAVVIVGKNRWGADRADVELRWEREFVRFCRAENENEARIRRQEEAERARRETLAARSANAYARAGEEH